MEVESKAVFQVDSQIVKDCFLGMDNFLIEYNTASPEGEGDGNYCAIYFASNEIYYPNNEVAFHNEIVKKNRFEWYRCRFEKASKHIFIRDIKKQWYIEGISDSLSSIEKILDFLKRETAGFKVVTIGSSAGGYASVLFGQHLGAERILSFNGQFMVSDLLESSTEDVNPTIFRRRDDKRFLPYYSLRSFVTDPETVFYFYSNKSAWDVSQLDHIKEKKINVISFNTSHHGIPFLKSSLFKVINMEKKELKELAANKHNPLWFSYQIEGMQVFRTIITLTTRKIKKVLQSKFKFVKLK